jgi:hypothetical protein
MSRVLSDAEVDGAVAWARRNAAACPPEFIDAIDELGHSLREVRRERDEARAALREFQAEVHLEDHNPALTLDECQSRRCIRARRALGESA